MTLETLRIEESDQIARIELARPEKRNAMNPAMAREIEATLRDLESKREIRAVLIRGADGHFCSGGDLAPDPGAPTPVGSIAANTLQFMNADYGHAILALHHFPKPVVALVEGTAAGAGASLAFACDLVYATPESRFCEIFVRRGLALDCGSSWLLPRLIGMQKAKELAFFGEWIEAPEAATLGLVNALFEAGEIEAAVDERLATLAARPPVALTQIKQSLHRSGSLTMAEALEMEAVAQAACAATEDCAEGLRAFVEKREPRFQGR
jgi:2-(1,2-epoxy-1,2-dihydrophenyl)acetyl-CoA isomerase